MEQQQQTAYSCTKCAHTIATKGELRAAGGFWSKIFDVQNKKFFTLSYERCGYTELYAKGSSRSENILDFITN